MNETKTNQLFSPIEIGSTRLKHRVVMAPLTRSRSRQPDGIPSDLMLEYYCQRASEGGLIIAEAAQLSIRSRGWHGAPGMYSAAQVDGWKKIVDVVHAKGGRIFAQLWHPGRFSHVTLTEGATPERCGELDAAIRDRLLPSLRVQEGFCGALHLVSRDSGEGMLIVLWETEAQAAHAVSERELAELAPAAGGEPARASVWEVTQRA